MKAPRRSASPSSTTRPQSTARDSRVKLWSRRIASASAVRPGGQRGPPPPAARRERGVPVDAPHAGAALEVALDGEGATDATVDQVAVREAEVGLEAVDARLAETVPHPGHVAGERHLDAHDGLAAQRAERARHEAHAGSEPAHRGLVGGAHEKVRRGPLIYDDRPGATLAHRR